MAEQELEAGTKPTEVTDLIAFQEEHRAWSLRNFGATPPYYPLLGVIEELGELSEAGALLEDLPSDDPAVAQAQADLVDAVGDIAIYICDVCNKRLWSFEELWNERVALYEAVPAKYKRTCSATQGRLAHHQLKGDQNIRGGTEHQAAELRKLLGVVLYQLEDGLDDQQLTDVTVLSILADTWGRVSKRDWVKNPNNAAEVASVAG